MSITDEMRKYVADNNVIYITPYASKRLFSIADSIDAEHERQLDVLYRDMSDAEWVRLPVDADGVPIRIGDALTDDAEFKSEGKVVRLMLEDEGWMVGLGCAGWTEPSIHEWHHYHAPTVEDVLCDLLNEYRENECTLEEARLSEYAAKLRLAEEDA